MKSISWFAVRELNSQNKRAKQLVIIVSLFVSFGFCSNSIAQIINGSIVIARLKTGKQIIKRYRAVSNQTSMFFLLR